MSTRIGGFQRETAEFSLKPQNSAGIECRGAFTTDSWPPGRAPRVGGAGLRRAARHPPRDQSLMRGSRSTRRAPASPATMAQNADVTPKIVNGVSAGSAHLPDSVRQ